VLQSVRWVIATAAVAAAFAVVWLIAEGAFELSNATSLEMAAVTAAVIGLPLSWWSFRGQLLEEPAEVGWVTWRRIPSVPPLALPRPAEEARLTAALAPRKGTDRGRPCPVVVITGASGVGKTQLAAGYARGRIADGWPLVAWINSGSHEEMLAGLLEFADALSLRVPDEGTARAVERLRQHPPTSSQPSLIVFDGVVDFEAVRPYLPTLPGWRVIVTTIRADVGDLGVELALTALEVDQASTQSGLPAQVCQRVGRLPVALDVAAATARELPVERDDLLRRLRSVPTGRLLGDGRDGARHDECYPTGGAETVLLALSGVGFDGDGPIRRLLGTLAVLSPGGVARSLLHELAQPEAVEEAVTRLGRWSLVTTRMDGDAVLLHELTRRVVLDRLRTEDALAQVIADAADLLDRATFGEDQAWPRRGEGDLLIAHIAALSTNAGSVSASLPAEVAERVLGLRQWATRQLSSVGDGARAVELAESICAECETLVGPDHPDSLAASDNLVIAYVAAGRVVGAVPLARRVLDARLRVLGPEHPDTLASRYTLGYAHEYAGQLDEAVPAYDRAFTEYARVLGPDHPQTQTAAGALHRVRFLLPTARGRHRSAGRPTPQQR
jgi:hypothetical protein